MIALSAPSFDTAGEIVSHQGVAIQQTTGRRAGRIATLDLGATLLDGGYTVKDLTFQVRIPDRTGSYHQSINRMIQYHSTAVMSCSRGCYVVLLSNLTWDRGLTVCTAEVVEAA